MALIYSKWTNLILILQKRALRFVVFADDRDHKIPLFLEANVLAVTFLYHECVSSLKMYDINSNNAPINTLHLFKKTSSIHSYNKDLKIEDGSCQRRLPEVIVSLEKLVRMSEPVDNGVLDL